MIGTTNWLLPQCREMSLTADEQDAIYVQHMFERWDIITRSLHLDTFDVLVDEGWDDV